MKRILIFAGTSEGRLLVESLSDKVSAFVCVATDYGLDLLPEKRENLEIHMGRLEEDAMEKLMREENFEYVIDTTHPFAKIVTENIKKAAEETGTRYIRILRETYCETPEEKDIVKVVPTMEAAAEYLNKSDEKVLLTVGSKELAKFTTVRDYQNRLFARVLPMKEVVNQCFDLGFTGKQLICMQGPFSIELNIAMIKQTKSKIVVTKDSGGPGGFRQKVEAALATGTELIVVSRPLQEEGYSLPEVQRIIRETYGDDAIYSYSKAMELKAKLENYSKEKVLVDKKNSVQSKKVLVDDLRRDYLPIFIDGKDKEVLVVGGGRIATRRIKSLLNFSCRVVVVAPEVSDDVEEFAKLGNVIWHKKTYSKDDLLNKWMVLSATPDKELNREICIEARKMGIWYNSGSHREINNFYFPGVICKGNLTLGITAQGMNHSLAAKSTQKLRDFVDNMVLEEE